MKKLLFILLALSGSLYALDVQLNVSTLGYGIGMSVPVSERWAITGAIDAVNYKQAFTDTRSVSHDMPYPSYYSTVLEYTSGISINNISFGLGTEYSLANSKGVKITAEGGLKFNYLQSNSENNLAVTKIAGSTSHTNNNSISGNTVDYFPVAPYIQANIRYYITEGLYVSGALGVEYTNFKVTDNSSGAALINMPLMPIAGLGIGYTF